MFLPSEMTTIGGENQAAASVQQTERCLHAVVESAERFPPPHPPSSTIQLHDEAVAAALRQVQLALNAEVTDVGVSIQM